MTAFARSAIHRMLGLTVIATLLSACVSAAPDSAPGAACDRSCLTAHIDAYLAAMLAHDPARLPLAPGARFTEDTATRQPADSTLWKNATAVRPFRQDYLDVRAGVAAAHVMVEEAGQPVMLALRLKVAGDRLAEIETMTVRNAQEGMFFQPEELRAPSAVMNRSPPPAARNTREELIRIAEGYPQGLKAGSFVTAGTRIAPGAYRFENGRRMAGPGCSFNPPSCEDMLRQRIPTLSGITWEPIAVDEEQGLVLLWLDFGPGSLMGADNRWLHAWEAFKVHGGQIHAAEAFMRGMPANTPRGW